MKRALINLHISVHEVRGNELREVTPQDIMKENNVPINTVVCFDGESDFVVLQKVRDWLSQGKSPHIPASTGST